MTGECNAQDALQNFQNFAHLYNVKENYTSKTEVLIDE